MSMSFDPLHRMFARAHLVAGSHVPLAGLVPLATFGEGRKSLDPVFFFSGLAVMSAGLVVLRAARLPNPAHAAAAPMASSRSRVALSADQALAERRRSAGETSVLVEALAAAAGTFYAIAGQLPGDVSAQVVRKADDLRELVWLNRGGRV